jgi:LacI family transcriptional regulator
MQNLLPYRPTAVFAANDLFAAGAARAIQEAGLRIPDDIALAGFTDTPQALALQPALTTVRVPLAELGAAAARLLVNRIENRGLAQQQTVLPGKLMVRGSTQKQ